MESNIKIFTALYFLIIPFYVFFLRSLMQWKRTGINPLVLPHGNSTEAFVGRCFKITLALVIVYPVINLFYPLHTYLLPILSKDHYHLYLSVTGIVILLISALITIVSQLQMRNSWRIGIDQKNETTLVTNGIFKYSRNPVFLGILLSIAGLFLIYPDTYTAILLIGIYLEIQIQIRFEESFLEKIFEAKYLEYKNRTRRLV